MACVSFSANAREHGGGTELVVEVGDATLDDAALHARLTAVIQRRAESADVTVTLDGGRRYLIRAPGSIDAHVLLQRLHRVASLTVHTTAEPASPGARRLESDSAEVWVEAEPALTGADFAHAAASVGEQSMLPIVAFNLTDLGRQRFCTLTRAHVNEVVAIALDGELLTAPVVREPICGGRGEIQGDFTDAEAEELALLINSGALPAPLTILEERTYVNDVAEDSAEEMH